MTREQIYEQQHLKAMPVLQLEKLILFIFFTRLSIFPEKQVRAQNNSITTTKKKKPYKTKAARHS